MAPKTKIIEGRKYRRSPTEYPRQRAYDKAKILRGEGYHARVESLRNGKFIIYVCEVKNSVV